MLLSAGLLAASGIANGLLVVTNVSADRPQCADGIDNDNDGKYDYPEDHDCQDLDDTYESPESQALFVSVTDGKDKVTAGDTLIYVIRLRQQRTEQRDVDVVMYLPSQANVVGIEPYGRQTDSGRIEWDNITVQKDRVTVMTVQAQVKPKSRTDQLVVARVVAENVAATDTTMVKGILDASAQANSFRVQISDQKEYVRPGDVLNYVITATNDLDEFRTATVRSIVPGQTYIEDAPQEAYEDGQSVTWKDIEFAPHETKTFAFSVRVQQRTHDNVGIYARVNVAAASDTDRTTVRRGNPPNTFSTAITDNRTTVEPGQFLTYSVHIRNHSEYPAIDPPISASVSTYADFVSADQGGYWDGNNVRWEGLEVAPKAVRTLSYVIRVRPDAPTDGQIIGGVKVDGVEGVDDTDRTEILSQSDEEEQGARPFSSHFIVGGSDSLVSGNDENLTRDGLLIRQVSDRDETVPGGRVRFQVVVTNTTGRVIEDGAKVSVRYDATAMEYIRSDDAARVLEGILQWELPRLEPGATWKTSYTLGVRGSTPHGSRTVNTAMISGGFLDDGSDGRVSSTRISVIRDLPETGAPLDMIAISLTSLAGMATGGTMLGRMRRKLGL